ncbi:RNA polymerase sigma factor [Actinoplanes bogorensis]|uniref:RNA polymerase sigma factor n=1 Tax=Paractinoplanes bogorensis TaxID=1610840 RepID=A0ABS5YU60_9ACTN|nr:sigma-70 family RNA polymerase sigma factor [Actinoplanes bogorensis]MBU2667001.1 RNA polymerase sigma factor [Actinoplanes bogorensis]
MEHPSAEPGNSGGSPVVTLADPAERLPSDAEFDPFFDRVYPELVKYGAFVWGNVSDAEEAAADSMDYLYRHWYSIDRREAYAKTMVVRAIGRRRKTAARHADQLNQAGPADPFADRNDGAAVTECVQRQWITEILQTLPPAQRAVMAGYFDQVPIADIAAAVGKTEAAVRKNLQLARLRLQRELERQRALDRPGPEAGDAPRPTCDTTPMPGEETP